MRYCTAGWPIVPVCHPTADQLVCGRSPDDPETAREWWSDRPYGIACRTGIVFDALQVPPWIGERLLPLVEHYATVIAIERPLEAASSAGRAWVEPLQLLDSMDADSAGSPVPPSTRVGGVPGQRGAGTTMARPTSSPAASFL